jgi:hypothetical protein
MHLILCVPWGTGGNKKGDELFRSGRFAGETFGFEPFEVRSNGELLTLIFADGLYRLGPFEDPQDFVGSHSEFFR